MSKKTNKSTAAEVLATWLVDHPGWHTVSGINADLGGTPSRSTITKTLRVMADNNRARRVAGDADQAGGKPSPDLWASHDTEGLPGDTTTDPDSGDAEPATGTVADTNDPQAAADATVIETDTAPDADGDATDVEDADAAGDSSESAPDISDEAAPDNEPIEDPGHGATEPSVEGEPQPGESDGPGGDDAEATAPATVDTEVGVVAPAPVVLPDTGVIAVAGVLRDHAKTGMTAAEVASRAGMSLGATWRVLIAMDFAGAAVNGAPFILDEGARWRPGDSDAALVRLDEVPPSVMCPTCGHESKVPGGNRSPRRGRASGSDVCADGAPPLAPGQLSGMVADFVAAHPGEQFTPGQVTRAIGARSSGAVLNALLTMVTKPDSPVGEVPGARVRTFRSTAPTPTD